jgi:hypothetical protein
MSAGTGLAARGYSWPPFGPDNPGVPAPEGNTRALTHGAYSARTWRPLADRIAAELPDIAPWCTRPTYGPAVAAWSRTEAQLQLVMTWLDEHGPLDKDGAPRPATALLAKLEAHARELRNDLGLSPLALAKLLSILDSAPAGTDDAGLEHLKAQGHRIVTDRTAALEAEATAEAAEAAEDGAGEASATTEGSSS